MPLARAHSHLPLNFWFSFFFDSHYDGIWRPSSLPTDDMTFVWNHCNAYFRGHGVSSGNATQFLRTNFIFIFSSVFFAENGIRVQPIDVNRLTTQCRLSLNSGFNFLGCTIPKITFQPPTSCFNPLSPPSSAEWRDCCRDRVLLAWAESDRCKCKRGLVERLLERRPVEKRKLEAACNAFEAPFDEQSGSPSANPLPPEKKSVKAMNEICFQYEDWMKAIQ